ncbi:hypothetical protein [Rhodoferax fermentans]|nr:hypothetical protein [Rhodoferax fermentans]
MAFAFNPLENTNDLAAIVHKVMNEAINKDIAPLFTTCVNTQQIKEDADKFAVFRSQYEAPNLNESVCNAILNNFGRPSAVVINGCNQIVDSDILTAVRSAITRKSVCEQDIVRNKAKESQKVVNDKRAAINKEIVIVCNTNREACVNKTNEVLKIGSEKGDYSVLDTAYCMYLMATRINTPKDKFWVEAEEKVLNMRKNDPMKRMLDCSNMFNY